MRSQTRRALVALLAAAWVSGWFGVGGLVGEAQAVIGRPLTPMSYAGVARRTTRRTVAVGAMASSPGYYY